MKDDGIFGPIVGASRDRTLVIGQFGQSLDGRIATATGESKYINGCEGLDHLHRLRSVVDAVLIGASTAVTDDPGLDVRRVEGSSPARVVIDPGGRVPASLRLFRDDGVRRIVVIGEDAAPCLPDGVEVIRLPLPEAGFAPHAIVAALSDAGLRRILVEGGARTVSRFIDAGALDRLHLIVAPVLLGDGPTGICLTQERSLAERLRPATRLFPLGGDVLFDCDFGGSRRHGEQVQMADVEA
ncbi:RibD family protein [Ancylobacter terrae]|uniref:RibD family protein n=1 Tax=Ancylobacter sp. sgz301288 TaxID=3342077 RepID=UPI003859BAC6